MPSTDRKLRVFLCHSSQDKPIVRELYQRLTREGWIDPWLDEEKLLPGQDWDLEIEKAVEAADVVVVCVSGKSVTKEGYVQKEIRKVLDIALEKPEETIFIIPIRLDDCELPRRLRSWHYVDYFPAERRGWAVERLLQSLKIRGDQGASELAGEDSLRGVDGRTNTAAVKPDVIVPSTLPAGSDIDIKSRIDMGGLLLFVVYFVVETLMYLGDSSTFLDYSKISLAFLTGMFFVIRKQIPASVFFKITIAAYMFLYSINHYLSQIEVEFAIGWPLLGVSAALAGGSLMGLLQAPRKRVLYSSLFLGGYLFIVGIQIILEIFDRYDSPVFIILIIVSLVTSVLMWRDM